MSSKEKVLSVYPDAFCSQIYDGDEPPVVIGYTVYRDGGMGPKLSNRRRTEAESWDDAASKLPSAPSPAGETASDYERCDNCDKPISLGPMGYVHEDSDQMMCERAEPKRVPEPGEPDY